MAIELATILSLGSLLSAVVLILIIWVLGKDHLVMRVLFLFFALGFLVLHAEESRVMSQLYFNQTIPDTINASANELAQINNLNIINNRTEQTFKWTLRIVYLSVLYLILFIIYKTIMQSKEAADEKRGLK